MDIEECMKEWQDLLTDYKRLEVRKLTDSRYILAIV